MIWRKREKLAFVLWTVHVIMRQKSSGINNRFVGWISKADCELLVKDEKVRYL